MKRNNNNPNNLQKGPHQAHAQHKKEFATNNQTKHNTTSAESQKTAHTHSNYHTKSHSQRPPYSSEHNQPHQHKRSPHSNNSDHNNRPHHNHPSQNHPPHNRPEHSNRPPHNRPPNNTINFPGSASIHKQRFERDFNFNNTTVLLLELENFLIETQNKAVENKINLKLEMQANNFIKNAITELYPLAVKGFLTAESNTYPFNPYASMLKYYISYNQNCHLSTYRDNYVFTGGAHGTTQRLANTYNLQTGNSVPLSSFFKRGTNYKKLLLSEIQKQATKNMQQNPNIYFDDYINLINQTFNEESFYLTKNGLVIYYGQYDIAPYVTGIVEFTIPYSMLDNPPTCKR